MAAKSLSKAKVFDIFKSMDYPNTAIDTSAAENWLYGRYGGQGSDTNTIKITFNDEKPPINYPYLNQPCVAKTAFEELENDTRWKDLGASNKMTALYKFAMEIDKNSEVLCQLELLLRNILPKDTKKYGVPTLKDYLQYYANWTEDLVSNHRADNANVVLCSTSMVFSLAEIGFFLGSALARGRNIVFYGEDTLCVILDFLIELSVKAGVPNGTIKAFYGSDTTFQSLCQMHIYKNIKIGPIEKFNDKKVMVTPHNKTSMIVFDDADLDSACETAVTAIWSCCGLLPWAVDTILVQENVFEKFVSKLKERVKKLQFGDKPTASDDVSFYQLSNWKVALDKTVKDAKSQGIEVFQPKDVKKLPPTLFIGGKIFGNKVMTENVLQVPAGTILGFRTSKEAASLANNSQQGLAVSVWSQNLSLVNEVVRKVDVGTVWVNCHGVIRANVGFTTRKYEGVGYIGGPEGLYELEELSSSTIDIADTKNGALLIATKKAQEAWNKLSFNARIEKLSKYIQNNGNSSKYARAFHRVVKELSSANTTQTVDNFDLKVYRDPVGVVIVNKIDDTLPQLVLSALLIGNAVLVIEDEQIKGEVEAMAKHLPSGVVGNITPNDLAAAFTYLKQSVVVIGNYKSVKRTLFCQKHYDTSDKTEIVKFALRRCSVSKNVWTDVGDSF